MKKALLLLLFAVSACSAVAQQTPPRKGDPDAVVTVLPPTVRALPDSSGNVYTSVERNPEFPGGEAKFNEYIKNNLKYPDEARKNNVEGRVFLMLIVEKDGSLSNIKVIRGIAAGCDEEAVRLLKNSPKWIPGINNGHPVRVSYVQPIRFSLNE